MCNDNVVDDDVAMVTASEQENITDANKKYVCVYVRKCIRICVTHVIHILRFLSGFWSKGVEMRCNVLLGGGGAKLYYIPESKAHDKLGEPGLMRHCAKHNARGSGGMPPGKF